MLKYSEILRALENCDFENLTQDDCVEKIIDCMDTNIIPDRFAMGASKLVLLLPDENFVIKIPFKGEYYDGEFYEFDAATTPDLECTWDYCHLEQHIFKTALECGAGDFLLETFCIGQVKDYPIYAQKKAETFYSCDSGKERYSPEEASRIYEKFDIDQLNMNWIMDFLAYYAEENLELLCGLIRESLLSDLHEGNIGYYEGRPVIFDYAGFWN